MENNLNIDFIETVKINGVGYLVNSTLYVPTLTDEIKQWLEEGNIPEPEFTEEELQAQEIAKKVQEAKAFLDKTDKKVLPDYKFREDDETLEWYIAERSKAREFVRSI